MLVEKIVHSRDDHWERGSKVFEDGREIPYCILHTHYPSKTVAVEYSKKPFAWAASEIKENRKTADGRTVYILDRPANFQIGILDGLPTVWKKDKFRFDGKKDVRDLV